MKQVYLIASICAGIAGAAVVSAGLHLTHQPQTPTARTIIQSLDPECMGCGVDAHNKESTPHAMAYALLASVGVSLDDEVLARSSADWLIQNSHQSAAAVGWGLSFAWDAFGDGSINPKSTVYGITTALAVRGLVDVFEKTGDEAYLKTAISALIYYSKFHTKTENGIFFWYSDQKSDSINTFNVTAMLIGQYARAGVLAKNAEFIRLADDAVADLLANKVSINGTDYWPYSTKNTRPNDAVHAAYVVQGLLDYSNAKKVNIDIVPATAYLGSFIAGDSVLEFSPLHPGKLSAQARPARLWGVGMLIYTLTEAGDRSIAQQAAANLSSYVKSDGDLANLPGGSGHSEPRMTTHAALGLARLQDYPSWR